MAHPSFSPLTQCLFMSTAAITAQSQRVLLLTQNIANANVKAPPGTEVYQRQLPVFAVDWNPTINAPLLHMKRVMRSKEPPIRTYSPGDPLADEKGYVRQPNISTMTEIADMREAGRSHEAALRAFERVLGMLDSVASLLKNT